MAALHDHFELKIGLVGSGWPALFVRVRNWTVPAAFEGTKMVFLTPEIINAEELDDEIDGLIDQLQALKKKGRKMLPKLEKTKS